MLKTSVAAMRFSNRVGIMYRTVLGEKKSEAAPTSSEGLEIKSSKREVSASDLSKAVISSITFDGEATLASLSGTTPLEVLGRSIGTAMSVQNHQKGFKK